jgi:hypothetical protein
MPTAEADQVQISALGHSRQKCDVRDTSAYPPIATVERTRRDVSNVPIVLQKSFCITEHNFSGP